MRLPDKLANCTDKIVVSPLNYWFGFVADASIAVIFLTVGLRTYAANPALCTLSVVAGSVTWGFIEYACHRWFFHGEHTPASKSHGRHHENPETLIALPWFTSTVTAPCLWLVLRMVIPAAPASFAVSTMALGYAYYGVLHHLEHHTEINDINLKGFKRWRAYHRVHHKMLDTNFGVTTSLWDRVFGTHYQSRRRAAGNVLYCLPPALQTAVSSYVK